MLFNEPKLLKFTPKRVKCPTRPGFSALQRAEIAEMFSSPSAMLLLTSFSALQRAEIAEIDRAGFGAQYSVRFSALQRAEIAEIQHLERVPQFHR